MYDQRIPFELNRFDPDQRLELVEDTIRLGFVVDVEVDFGIFEDIAVLKIRDTLIWTPPSEPHTGFIVRITEGSVVDPDAEAIDVGLETSLNLRGIAVTAGAAGETFSFAVAAYNAAGNEGPDGVLEGVVLDFTAPGAPTGLAVVQS